MKVALRSEHRLQGRGGESDVTELLVGEQKQWGRMEGVTPSRLLNSTIDRSVDICHKGRLRHAHQISHRLYAQSTGLACRLVVDNAPLSDLQRRPYPYMTTRTRLERASQKQSSDTHETPRDRVKRYRERKINTKASERVNVDVWRRYLLELCKPVSVLPTEEGLPGGRGSDAHQVPAGVQADGHVAAEGVHSGAARGVAEAEPPAHVLVVQDLDLEREVPAGNHTRTPALTAPYQTSGRAIRVFVRGRVNGRGKWGEHRKQGRDAHAALVMLSAASQTSDGASLLLLPKTEHRMFVERRACCRTILLPLRDRSVTGYALATMKELTCPDICRTLGAHFAAPSTPSSLQDPAALLERKWFLGPREYAPIEVLDDHGEEGQPESERAARCRGRVDVRSGDIAAGQFQHEGVRVVLAVLHRAAPDGERPRPAAEQHRHQALLVRVPKHVVLILRSPETCLPRQGGRSSAQLAAFRRHRGGTAAQEALLHGHAILPQRHNWFIHRLKMR
ncbi:hypothetical protein PR048_024422 [Dryococelus australis]|uniref:Uncharacterized protein n=1 Tax=Dryococelus australis TaxID=614101 RepID=A0ABQ9GNK9_9NEOP|nr:hypothetical protein PR048_024422 [Dryococelus australis]